MKERILSIFLSVSLIIICITNTSIMVNAATIPSNATTVSAKLQRLSDDGAYAVNVKKGATKALAFKYTVTNMNDLATKITGSKDKVNNMVHKMYVLILDSKGKRIDSNRIASVTWCNGTDSKGMDITSNVKDELGFQYKSENAINTGTGSMTNTIRVNLKKATSEVINIYVIHGFDAKSNKVNDKSKLTYDSSLTTRTTPSYIWKLKDKFSYLDVKRAFSNDSVNKKFLYMAAGVSVKLTTSSTSTTEPNKEITYVYFGSYPRSEVKGKALTDAIINADYNKDNIAEVDGEKYIRMCVNDGIITTNGYDWSGGDKNTWHYFKFEPIKWRVIEDNNGVLTLLTEEIIDVEFYNYSTYIKHCVWEDSGARIFLNDTFYNHAFNKTEQSFIKTTTLVNKDNPYKIDKYTNDWVYNNSTATDGGNNTKDKVYLLSLFDYLSVDYGFLNDISKSTSDNDYYKNCKVRTAKLTEYTFARGLRNYSSYGQYWTRTVGSSQYCSVVIGALGSTGESLVYDINGYRPTIRIDKTAIQ